MWCQVKQNRVSENSKITVKSKTFSSVEMVTPYCMFM